MVDSAMKARFKNQTGIIKEWTELKIIVDRFSKLRNEVAHLTPTTQPSTDPEAKANVRLVPPFWKGIINEKDYNKTGYSVDELWQKLKDFWGYHPRIRYDFQAGEKISHQLSYRLAEFTKTLVEPSVSVGVAWRPAP